MLQKTSDRPEDTDNVLVLVRHGQSEWNRLNMFTGWKDVGLSEEGVAEAHRAGGRLKEEGLVFDSAFASTLKRAHNTLDIILGEVGQGKLPIIKAAALNERDYGDLVGINKEEARKRFGAEKVQIWQRSYDVAPPGGESLKDTAARVCPFFDRWIVPELQSGKNVIVVAHGNSLRSLIMELDKLTPEEVQHYSLATATPVIYRVQADGTLAEKRSLAA
ncbi:MAG: 2,3-bisphosphoglycerate-dependent phosphoglycerate mutase [Methyloceanibacter sp.]|jgi:2,3-bisphosphoglycerate-dependent phosphoglycerate mutase